MSFKKCKKTKALKKHGIRTVKHYVAQIRNQIRWQVLLLPPKWYLAKMNKYHEYTNIFYWNIFFSTKSYFKHLIESLNLKVPGKKDNFFILFSAQKSLENHKCLQLLKHQVTRKSQIFINEYCLKNISEHFI